MRKLRPHPDRLRPDRLPRRPGPDDGRHRHAVPHVLVRRYGSGLNVTEMVASQAAIRETRQSLQKTAWHLSEEPVSMQLVGCTPYEMGEAAKLAEDRGAAIIDINMGCPVRKVTNGDAGSALMRDTKLAAAIIAGVVKAVSAPVTLKMRMGWDHRLPERARSGAHRRGSGRQDDHRPRSHPQPDVQGHCGLGLHPHGEGCGVRSRDRQWRHLLGRGCRCGARTIGRGRRHDRPRCLRPSVAARAGDDVAVVGRARARSLDRRAISRDRRTLSDDARPLWRH